VAKNTCYIVLQAAATALPPLAVAAHQPVWGVWNIGGFAHAPLEQAALAFLPAARTKADAREVVAVRRGPPALPQPCGQAQCMRPGLRCLRACRAAARAQKRGGGGEPARGCAPSCGRQARRSVHVRRRQEPCEQGVADACCQRAGFQWINARARC